MMIHNNQVQIPVLKGAVTWETSRKSAPGKLQFTCIKMEGLDFQEGDAVRFSIGGTPVFYGFVFVKQRGSAHHIKVTCYDQLRYFKNKETIQYTDTASGLLRRLAADFSLQLGEVEETGTVLESRLERNKTLFDIMGNALDETLTTTGRMYVLYDMVGKLCLRDVESLQLPLVLTANMAEDFDYSSSIDGETYNRIQINYEDEKTKLLKQRYLEKPEAIKQWGVLQYVQDSQEPIDAKAIAKAESLLGLYCNKTRKLTVKGVCGDARVRAGTSIVTNLGLGDINISNYLLVESAKHSLSEGIYTMDLDLAGGEHFG